MPISFADLKTLLGIAHDLVCSVLLFVIVVMQSRQHHDNVNRLTRVERHVRRLRGLPVDDENSLN